MAVTLIVNIKVENFDKWKTVFDGAEEFRKKAGIVLKDIYQSAEDEKSICLISEYPNLEVAKAIISNPQWEENQRKSGVIGGFDVKYYNSIV